MEALKISNNNELELTVTTVHPTNYDVIFGGMSECPSWDEYLEIDYFKKYKAHLELIKRAIEKLHWIGETAENKANKWCFVFSDGVALSFSWRGWGDLMSAIVDKREGYMTYYM